MPARTALVISAHAADFVWRCGGAKFFMDGVVETGTAWLVEPDSKRQGLHPFWPEPERYAEAVSIFAKAGFQCITHAVGDRAVQAALDAYEAAGVAPGVHHRIEHIELVQDRDIGRFAQLGVVASMQPYHGDPTPAHQNESSGVECPGTGQPTGIAVPLADVALAPKRASSNGVARQPSTPPRPRPRRSRPRRRARGRGRRRPRRAPPAPRAARPPCPSPSGDRRGPARARR